MKRFVVVLAILSAPALAQTTPDALATLRARSRPTPLDTITTAFTHVRLLPMRSDSALLDRTVIVRDGRIARIGPSRGSQLPRGARVVDGTGLTMIPGLADMHVHLRYLKNGADNPAILTLLLANGVTTAMNLLGLPEHLDLRARIDSGQVVGPVLYTTGFWINTPYVRTPTEVDSAVRAQKAAGYDMIKIHGELDSASFHTLYASARREGIPVIGHASRTQGLRALLDERQYAIAHVEEYLYSWFGFRRSVPIPSDSLLPLVSIAARETAKAGSWVMPTLTVFNGIAAQITSLDSVLAAPETQHLPAAMRGELAPGVNRYADRRNYPSERVPELVGQARLLARQTLELHRAGTRLVLGTDAGVPGVVPGFSVASEIKALVSAGLTPYEAIRTATTNAAAFVAAEREFGTIAEGMRADLVMLSGDPLTDIGVVARPVGVMVRGRWYDRRALDQLLQSLRQ